MSCTPLHSGKAVCEAGTRLVKLSTAALAAFLALVVAFRPDPFGVVAPSRARAPLWMRVFGVEWVYKKPSSRIYEYDGSIVDGRITKPGTIGYTQGPAKIVPKRKWDPNETQIPCRDENDTKSVSKRRHETHHVPCRDENDTMRRITCRADTQMTRIKRRTAKSVSIPAHIATTVPGIPFDAFQPSTPVDGSPPMARKMLVSASPVPARGLRWPGPSCIPCAGTGLAMAGPLQHPLCRHGACDGRALPASPVPARPSL